MDPVPGRRPRVAARPGRAAILLLLPALARAATPSPATPPAADRPGATADRSEIRLTVGEEPILDWLKAATPYTLTIGGGMVGADLVFEEPSDLHLKDGTASLKIRVKARSFPLDQVVSPVVSLTYDPGLNKYFGVLASLPLQIPGLGTVDLKDYVPRFEIPDVLQDFWRFSDRPVGLTLRIRKIAIRDRLLEVGADVAFGPGATGARSAR